MKSSPPAPKLLYALCIVIVAVAGACSVPSASPTPTPPPDRTQSVPAGAVKVQPSSDIMPPRLHSTDYLDPVPLGGGVNTAGAEDSPFILPDGNTLYFFFTPDANVPAEKQLLDGVTGIWSSTSVNGEWTAARRVVLQDSNELALDGAQFLLGDKMWFASARQGNYRGVDIWMARFANGRWTEWQNAGRTLNVDYKVGELHITADGAEMYFHSPRAGGKGDYDIWVTRKVDREWQPPENVAEVNSAGMDGWPCVTPDGQELWFTRTYLGTPAIYRSKRVGDRWSEPELVLSQFAGEPSLDSRGNIYFVHHFYKDNRMIEADIYVAYRR